MLGNVLPVEAFGFLLVTVRLAALVMVMPILGESSVPGRIRAGLALTISVIVYSSVRDLMPPMPESVFGLFALMFREFLVGIIIGLATRILMSATHVAGTVIAFQTGLAAAQSFDPAQGSQSALVAAFMTYIAITLIVVFDLHHLMILGMAHSYQKFPVGEVLPYADFATLVTEMVSDSFLLGFHMASPFIAYGLIFNLSLGLISRMVQGFQVFFIGMPVNIFMGFSIMMLLIGGMMQLFLDRFRDLLLGFLG
ncbi:flagellar biosynthetic protein FliR [Kordiimonas aestuarii]|uniref:flagellar biosynthetic protein FliR n=1 Tax=Kordiimonas aestuarii TaxID=1005925 RepID=UPI0021D253F8|nr:flagellar biosynthetic protein FliR [Kordiimonas aestuarii]